MLDFCAEHGIGAEVEVIAADQINEAYERVLASDVRYRFVIDTATPRLTQPAAARRHSTLPAGRCHAYPQPRPHDETPSAASRIPSSAPRMDGLRRLRPPDPVRPQRSIILCMASG